MSPELARSCRSWMSAIRSLSRAKQTWGGHPILVATDPNETLDIASVLFRRRRIKTTVSNLGAHAAETHRAPATGSPYYLPFVPSICVQVGDM